ncbi:MAG: Trm112 family protein [Desulfovibrio sp.]|nr:Trm112 family protein [Desulfovibrio sp.]
MELQDLLKIIACPKCHGDLSLLEPEALLCASCGLVYPIRDGIPILLIEDAKPLEEWKGREKKVDG